MQNRSWRISFEEIGTNALESVLREVVERLDSMVGWLVFFGRVDLDTLDEILKAAEGVVNEEQKVP